MNKKRILVIDDEVFIRELVKDFLDIVKITCDEAENYQTALRLVSENKYHLILLDRNLLNKKAEDLIIEIKEKTKTTPVVLLTGDYSCTEEYLREIGVAGVIFKPFKADDFMKKIEQYLGS